MVRHLLRIVAVTAIGALALLGGALATGQVAYVATSGTSMEPTYSAGDLVVIARSGEYAVGQNVAYRTPGGVVALHRIVGADADGFDLQGDNNTSIDPDRPTGDEILGREILHLPRLGDALTSTVVRGALLLVVLTLLGGLLMSNDRPGTDRPATRPAGTSRTTRAVWATFLTLSVVLLAAVGIVWATEPGPGEVDPPGLQTGRLAYGASLPESDTYPDGVVETGDPVFLELLTDVDVGFDWSTDRPRAEVTGTADLTVEVTAASGWTTTVDLAPSTPLSGGRVDLRGTLDLTEVRELADTVTVATGVTTEVLDVEVIADVDASVDGEPAPPFRSSASFTLDRSQLSPVDFDVDPDAVPPAVTTSLELTDPDPASATDDGLRRGLLIALLVSVGLTALLWPTRAEAALNTTSRTIDLPDSHALVELADRSELERIALRVNAPLLEGLDGWAGVIGPGAVYWVRGDATETVASDPDDERDDRPADDDRPDSDGLLDRIPPAVEANARRSIFGQSRSDDDRYAGV